MDIEIVYRSEKEVEKCDGREAMKILINGKHVFEVGDGEPEDATLLRDFNDVYFIPNILRTVYEAGKNGEELNMFFTDSDEL